MSLALVVLLGVLQGVTEFLPVSSSGHLRLLSEFFGVRDPQTTLDVFLHVGSLAAVFFVYRALFARMLRATWSVLTRRARFAEEPDARLVAYAIAATVPTGAIGLLAGPTLEVYATSVVFVGAALVVNGVLLLGLGALTRRAASADTPLRPLDQLRLRDALFVGTVQGLGIVRGISRSGSTITAGLLTGLDRDASAALSFVLSVPAILGALALQLRSATFAAGDLTLLLTGALVAAITGTLALTLLLRLLRRGRLHHFAWYCFALGGLSIAWGAAT